MCRFGFGVLNGVKLVTAVNSIDQRVVFIKVLPPLLEDFRLINPFTIVGIDGTDDVQSTGDVPKRYLPFTVCANWLVSQIMHDKNSEHHSTRMLILVSTVILRRHMNSL